MILPNRYFSQSFAVNSRRRISFHVNKVSQTKLIRTIVFHSLKKVIPRWPIPRSSKSTTLISWIQSLQSATRNTLISQSSTALETQTHVVAMLIITAQALKLSSKDIVHLKTSRSSIKQLKNNLQPLQLFQQNKHLQN